MNQDQLLAGLKKDVRSLLVSSKQGLTPEQLKKDYQSTLGYPIPLRVLGFRNVLDMVKEMPDVVRLEFQHDGDTILKAIGDETTRGIEELVSKQRCQKIRSGISKFKPRYFHFSRPPNQPVILPRWGQVKPALPAQLRSQLKQLLSFGPVRLSELEYRYLSQFGKPLQITQYGFYSITEMLTAAMDFIVMIQSRTGTQLLLKRPVKSQFTPTMRLSNQFRPPKEKLPGFFPKAQKLDVTSEPPLMPKSESVKDKQTFEETVIKLEKELRQQILEKAAAGTVSDELKNKLRKVVSEDVNGISIYNLPDAYKKMFSEELPVSQCGFLSVIEMVGALSDTLSIQRPLEENKNQWIVTAIMPNGTLSTDSSPAHDTTSSLSTEHSPKGHYFRCPESAWDPEKTEQCKDSQEAESKLRVTNKTIHEMVNLLPELRVSSATSIPLDAVRSQSLKPPARRMERELLPVLVEKAESPSYFFIRFSKNKEARALENMMIEMRSCYAYPQISERYRLPDTYVRPGQVCCVAPRDMWFYRVVVHEVLGATEVKVFYVDYGDVSKVERQSLRFLKACYADLPAQAVPAMLAGIRPVTSSWTQCAIKSFQKLCCDRTLVGAIHSYQDDFLKLFLCDTNTEDDVYIHLLLQQQGHAVPCSTSYVLVSDKFNPVTSYFRNERLEGIKDSVGSSFSYPKSQENPALRCSKMDFNSESGENLTSSIHLDLPPLTPINIDGETSVNIEDINPFEAPQTKDSLFDIEWDQGWTTADKTDGITEESKPETVCTPLDQRVEREEQSSESPDQAMTFSNRNGSSSPSDLIQVNCSFPGVPVFPVQPPLSKFMRHLQGSPIYLGAGSVPVFQHLSSPLALRPSARMSAGASLQHWPANQFS